MSRISISSGSRLLRLELKYDLIYLYPDPLTRSTAVVGSTLMIVNPPTYTTSSAVFPSSSVTTSLITSPALASAGTSKVSVVRAPLPLMVHLYVTSASAGSTVAVSVSPTLRRSGSFWSNAESECWSGFGICCKNAVSPTLVSWVDLNTLC